MKILQSIRSVNPEGGGVIETVKQFSGVLEDRGHEVTIVSLDAPDDPWVRACSHRVEALGPARGGYGLSPRLLPWLREHAANFDTVVVNGLWQYHSFAVWRAFHGTGRNYFVFPHGMLDPWFKRTYPLKHAKKWLYWPWAEYRVLRDASAVLFTCEQERELARRSFWLYRANERVVPLGIADPFNREAEQDPGADRRDDFPPLTSLGTRADSGGVSGLSAGPFLDRFPSCRGKRLVLFLGRIHEKKGCDLLLRAFAAVAGRDPALQLVMAGPEQQDASSMRALAASLGIAPRVVWTGMLGGEVKWGAFRAADVFILPSHQENFGIAVVESLACGVPVLISREVNIWREIVAGGAGFAAPDDVSGTVGLLERWLATPADEQDRMRCRARECFLSSFEIGRAVENLLNVIDHGRRFARASGAVPPSRRLDAYAEAGAGGGRR